MKASEDSLTAVVYEQIPCLLWTGLEHLSYGLLQKPYRLALH